MTRAAACIALLLSVLALLLPPAGRDLDHKWVARAREWSDRSPALRAFMQAGTELGSSEPLLVGCFLASAYGPEPVRSTARIVFWSLGANQIAAESLKYAIGRPRPTGEPARKNSSFPSAHASAAGGLAWIVAQRHRRWAAIGALVAVWIASSRVFLGRHYPSDVFAGLLLGVVFAIAALAIAERLAAPHGGSSEEPWRSATT